MCAADGTCSKCSGERPYCETCTRRGFSHTCFYVRQTVQGPPVSNSDEVLQKLNRIENLLERQGQFLEHRFDPVSNSYSSNQDNSSQHRPSSLSLWTEVDAPYSETTDSLHVGTILKYGKGYERFVPGIATADADAINELIQSTSVPPTSTNFPFTDEAGVSRQALLEALPAPRQCDELKDIFFDVFSPVRPFLELFQILITTSVFQ